MCTSVFTTAFLLQHFQQYAFSWDMERTCYESAHLCNDGYHQYSIFLFISSERCQFFLALKGMTISLLLGYDYYLSACKGVCGICLHLNFRRNMQTECRPWKMICRALMRSSTTVGPCIGMNKMTNISEIG